MKQKFLSAVEKGLDWQSWMNPEEEEEEKKHCAIVIVITVQAKNPSYAGKSGRDRPTERRTPNATLNVLQGWKKDKLWSSTKPKKKKIKNDAD